MKMSLFYLTCADDWEADRISKALFNKKLIVCAKKLPVDSMFLWKRKISETDETLLLMESVEENFDKVNSEVKNLSSYKTYVLFSIPVNKTTKEVKDWMKEELGN